MKTLLMNTGSPFAWMLTANDIFVLCKEIMKKALRNSADGKDH